MRTLSNVDFLSHDISFNILEELAYTLKPEVVGVGQYLLKAGSYANSIILIVDGEFDVTINNNNQECVIDTLYSGCTVGGYSVLNGDPHTVSIKAKQDSNILILESELLDAARGSHPELDHYMTEYEDYIENWGLPYCDYRIYRHRKKGKHDPFLKFRVGMHRILNIIKSSKTEIHINDMMKRVQD